MPLGFRIRLTSSSVSRNKKIFLKNSAKKHTKNKSAKDITYTKSLNK